MTTPVVMIARFEFDDCSLTAVHSLGPVTDSLLPSEMIIQDLNGLEYGWDRQMDLTTYAPEAGDPFSVMHQIESESALPLHAALSGELVVIYAAIGEI